MSLARWDRIRRGEPTLAPECEPTVLPPLDLSSPAQYAELLAATLLLCERAGWISPRLDEAASTWVRPATLLERCGAWTAAQARATKRSSRVRRGVQSRAVGMEFVPHPWAELERPHLPRGAWFFARMRGVVEFSVVAPPVLWLTEHGRVVAERRALAEEIVVGVTCARYIEAIEGLRDAPRLPAAAFASGSAASWRFEE